MQDIRLDAQRFGACASADRGKRIELHAVAVQKLQIIAHLIIVALDDRTVQISLAGGQRQPHHHALRRRIHVRRAGARQMRQEQKRRRRIGQAFIQLGIGVLPRRIALFAQLAFKGVAIPFERRARGIGKHQRKIPAGHRVRLRADIILKHTLEIHIRIRQHGADAFGASDAVRHIAGMQRARAQRSRDLIMHARYDDRIALYAKFLRHGGQNSADGRAGGHKFRHPFAGYAEGIQRFIIPIHRKAVEQQHTGGQGSVAGGFAGEHISDVGAVGQKLAGLFQNPGFILLHPHQLRQRIHEIDRHAGSVLEMIHIHPTAQFIQAFRAAHVGIEDAVAHGLIVFAHEYDRFAEGSRRDGVDGLRVLRRRLLKRKLYGVPDAVWVHGHSARSGKFQIVFVVDAQYDFAGIFNYGGFAAGRTDVDSDICHNFLLPKIDQSLMRV